MNEPLIEIYNSPKIVDLWRMKEECHQYYKGCFDRFKRGEQFYPLGFARTDYPNIAYLLMRTLYSLSNKDVLDSERRYLLRLHFNKHFEVVPVWNADWSRHYYIPNFWELWQPFHVHSVIAVETRREGTRKHRYAVLESNEAILMDSAFFLRQARQSYTELIFPEKLYRADWQLALHREISNFYKEPSLKPRSSTEATILSFPSTTK